MRAVISFMPVLGSVIPPAHLCRGEKVEDHTAVVYPDKHVPEVPTVTDQCDDRINGIMWTKPITPFLPRHLPDMRGVPFTSRTWSSPTGLTMPLLKWNCPCKETLLLFDDVDSVSISPVDESLQRGGHATPPLW
jgi:hypothetical protein